jgi:sulfur carrier protein
MKIWVNGQTTEVSSGLLGDILVELGYGDDKIATAINEGFIAQSARGTTRLTLGDRLEIVAPRQGG